MNSLVFKMIALEDVASALDFSTSNVWSFLLLFAVLFVGIMLAHIIKNNIPFMKKSLMPASVLGGLIILVFCTIWKLLTKESFFDMTMFSIVKNMDDGVLTTQSGSDILQIVTYHCLGVGFVAMGLKINRKNESKVKPNEVFNTGVITVSTYLLQATLGLVITIIAVNFIAGLVPGSGALLCLGFGQGTGQALTWGTNYQRDNGFVGGSYFGLSIAALGFLAASIGGVIYLNYLRRKNRLASRQEEANKLDINEVHSENDIPLTGSIDKFTIQVAMVLVCYALSYLLMLGLSKMIPGMKSTIFGFNFLLGILMAVLLKTVLNVLHKKGIIKKEYINNFMLNRIAGIAFDVMIVAGIAVIDLQLIIDYWAVLLILAVVGTLATFVYIKYTSRFLFKDYENEQFFAMYGMLTGTASTGMILLREIDPNFETPAADNLVYQNLPAIIFGFPIMLLFKDLNTRTIPYLFAIIGFFFVLQIILFRKQIFRRKKKENKTE